MMSAGYRSASQAEVPPVGMSPVASSRQSSSRSSRLIRPARPRNASNTPSRPWYWNRYSAEMSLARWPE